jgi:hypothetical protein
MRAGSSTESAGDAGYLPRRESSENIHSIKEDL